MWATFSFIFLVGAVTSALELAVLVGKKIRAGEKTDPIRRLEISQVTIQSWIDQLESGQLLEPEHWQKLSELSDPWRSLLPQTLKRLREDGASILPSLRRVRQTLEEELSWFQEARIQVSQTQAQSAVGIFMVLGSIGISLFLIPEVMDEKAIFASISAVSIVISAASAYWIQVLCERARFANLPHEKRQWLASVQFIQEQFISSLETGLPPDLAWLQVQKTLSERAPELVSLWSATGAAGLKSRADLKTIQAIRRLGVEVSRTIQISRDEGKSCSERVGVLFQNFRLEWRAIVNQELRKLPTRSLKPLFLCTMPACVLPMGFAVCMAVVGSLNL